MGAYSPIGVVAVRVASLAQDGTPLFNNPTGGFMMCGGVSTFVHDFDLDTGADIFEKDAAGAACVIRKRRNQVKRATFTLTMCKDDHRLAEKLVTAVDAVVNGPNVVGRVVNVGAGCTNPDLAGGAVALELWAEAWDCNVPRAGFPYVRYILPMCFLDPKGHTLQDGVSAPVYDGYVQPNPNFTDGPFGDLDLLATYSGWCMAELDDVAVPPCPVGNVGYVNIPGSAS